MKEAEALSKMVSPGMKRPNAYRQGIIQIHVTQVCDRACVNCTQLSQIRQPKRFISLENFEKAVVSLKDYFGVIGVFGGNPAVSPKFPQLCEILAAHIPWERRGIWCNNPLSHGKLMRKIFNPSVSNLNVHMDKWAYKAFKQDWPESRPVGLESDSRHASGFVAMQDVIDDPEVIWEKISACDINQFWSAMICEFRGELRGYFCEIAGAQAMFHQTEPDYPDLGVPIEEGWWRKTMTDFAAQARYHCFACGFPMRAEGALATHPDSAEQVSKTHAEGYVPKQSNRKVEEVQTLVQLGVPLGNVTRYVQNAEK